MSMDCVSAAISLAACRHPSFRSHWLRCLPIRRGTPQPAVLGVGDFQPVLRQACGRRYRVVGVAGDGSGHALRGLFVDAGTGASWHPGRCLRPGQCRQQACQRRLVCCADPAVAMDGCAPGAGLPLAACVGCVCPGPWPQGGASCAVALAGRRILHDAGHDVCGPGVRGGAGGDHARH